MTGLGIGASAKNYDALQARALSGASIPPSVGGLNVRDALANMDPRDATLLDNLFPSANNIALRKGHASHATGMTGTIETLMEWSGPASRKLKAANNGNIYDVTSAGAVGAAEVTGLSENSWQWVNFGTSGGKFLVAVNGTDAVRNYNGSAWSTPSITGIGLSSSAAFINVAIWKNRLWFVEKDTTNAWYLPVSSISGTAVKQDLGTQFKMGGKLVAIGTISKDSGDGVDDYIVFISSLGELAVYQGTDPATANSYALVGTYRVGYPIGFRCLVDVGGDLGVICADGVLSVWQAMQNDRATAARQAITNKIQTLFNQYVVNYGTNEGWMPLVYPKGNWVMFNIPFSSTQYVQLVMNTTTGSWCRFTALNGFCWGLLGNDIYFGATNGVVYKADTGYQDNGGVITAQLRTAWNYFNQRGTQNYSRYGAR